MDEKTRAKRRKTIDLLLHKKLGLRPHFGTCASLLSTFLLDSFKAWYKRKCEREQKEHRFEDLSACKSQFCRLLICLRQQYYFFPSFLNCKMGLCCSLLKLPHKAVTALQCEVEVVSLLIHFNLLPIQCLILRMSPNFFRTWFFLQVLFEQQYLSYKIIFRT